ncbi:MAG: toxin [Actinobacteria bacterium]|nr:toxin [Actinomycetota bacterium]
MPDLTRTTGFHDLLLAESVLTISPAHWDTQFTYTFHNFSHPFVGDLIAKVNTESVEAMLDPAWLAALSTPDPGTHPDGDYFRALYQPRSSNLVQVRSFRQEIDVSPHGAYAGYNWELLFHLPLTIAVQLSKARRFAEAQRWFHVVFDPTCTDTQIAPPARFWKFLAFRAGGPPGRIDELLTLLSRPPDELTPDEQQARTDVLNGYRAILDTPFQPHAVARTRHIAYQYSVVMKYLDNLIAWGDDLFQQDTVESINEASQRYVLAANLLGPRPQRVPPRGAVAPKTFADLKAAGLDPMANALVELESHFPFNAGPVAPGGPGDDAAAAALYGIGSTLYFCVPRNPNLLMYWDTVADRLFKIRHCMNIAGVVRPLALFDPPIDPGLLVKAGAAGVDLSTPLSGLTQPVGPLRALPMIQKALELCAQVRDLGSALLSAQEKGDAEALARVRQRHEIQIQQMTQDARFVQWKQAQEATEALVRSRAGVLERYRHYRRLLGLADSDVSAVLTVDRRELTEDNFDDAYQQLVGQYGQVTAEQSYPPLVTAPEAAADLVALTLQTGNLHLNLSEFLDLNVLGPAGLVLRALAGSVDVTTAALSMLPDAYLDALPMGVGGHTQAGGGETLSRSGRSTAGALGTAALISEFAAGYAAKVGSYQRRTDEWILGHNQAANDLGAIGRQILASLIAEQIAHHDYDTVKQQVVCAQEVDQLLHDKFSDQDLYLWMQGEISRLYYQWYRLAFDTARRAERTMKQELMRPELDAQDFVQFNYWDGGRKGLLAGEALHLDVKRMEIAYHDNNKRELELVSHVSLRQLDPVALLALRAAGSCTVTVPEWLFDRDCPGHYLRRIKSVAVSIPSVVGPYAGVNCTLSLLRSTVRVSAALADGAYPRQGADDPRFVDLVGAQPSIVTSTAVADTGMFEAGLHEERFLPFEGAGAESTWKIELPTGYPTFDYSTISDVILHLRYTARRGVDAAKVDGALRDLLARAGQTGLALMVGLRHDLADEWQEFITGTDDFSATVDRTLFPYFTQSRPVTIVSLQLYGADVSRPRTIGDPAAATSALAASGAFAVDAAADPPGPGAVLTRSADADVFLVVRYTL